jgi:hypothetical protein
VIDVDESRPALAKENLARVDVVGLTGAYTDCLGESRIRFARPVPPGRRANASPPAVKRPSESLVGRVAEDNAIDIEFDEYAKRLVHRRRRARQVDA